MTDTHSDGRTRYYPTATHKFNEKLGRKTKMRTASTGKQKCLRSPNRTAEEVYHHIKIHKVRSQQEAAQKKRGKKLELEQNPF